MNPRKRGQRAKTSLSNSVVKWLTLRNYLRTLRLTYFVYSSEYYNSTDMEHRQNAYSMDVEPSARQVVLCSPQSHL
jgi:hypothetical protein